MNWKRSIERAALWGSCSAVLVGGLAGLFVWHSVRTYERALAEYETRVGSPRHEDYLREAVAPDHNRAALFEEASAGVELTPEWQRLAEPIAWDEQSKTAAREALDRNRASLANLASAARAPVCAWSSASLAEAERLVPMLEASRLLQLDGFDGVVAEESERVQEAFQILGSLAECLYAAPNIVGSMIGARVERARLAIVHAALSSAGSSAGLLEVFEVELEALSAIDRVRWAVAAEGAHALRLLERQGSSVETLEARLRSPFFRRMGAELASRWIELALWSEGPLEDLIAEAPRAPQSGPSVAGVIADLAIPNIRHAIVGLRTNQAVIDLSRFAIAARLQGLRSGTYSGAFDGRAGLKVLDEGDGSVVLIDGRLESLLRSHLSSSAGDPPRGAESPLDLTVWRLPPPKR